jgi:hypothetical protein
MRFRHLLTNTYARQYAYQITYHFSAPTRFGICWPHLQGTPSYRQFFAAPPQIANSLVDPSLHDRGLFNTDAQLRTSLTLRWLMSYIYIYIYIYIYMEHLFLMFLDHTQRRSTVGRTPLDEWSAPRRDLYLTTQRSQQTNTHAPGGIQTNDLSR